MLSPLWLQINHILHKRNIGFRFQNLQFLWIMPPSKRTCVWSSKSDSWGDATSEKIISIQRCALNKKEKQVEKKISHSQRRCVFFVSTCNYVSVGSLDRKIIGVQGQWQTLSGGNNMKNNLLENSVSFSCFHICPWFHISETHKHTHICMCMHTHTQNTR